MNYFYTFLLSVLILAPGCKSTQEQSSTDATVEAPVTRSQPVTMMTGTVRYIDLEGGFYGIEADDGARYYPLNLSGVYKEDGLQVRFSINQRSDIMTTVMWGQVCEIVEIEKR